MSSIVADELAKIKSFETDTEKRRSELTLNELNYISDKQLHKKDSGGDGDWDFLCEVTPSAEAIVYKTGDFATYKEKMDSNHPVKVGIFVSQENGSTITSFISPNLEAVITDDSAYFIVWLEEMIEIVWHSDNTIEPANNNNNNNDNNNNGPVAN